MEKPKVVVTGIGLIAPIGVGVESYWKAALAGVSGSRRITHFDPTALPSQMAATLDDNGAMESVRLEMGMNTEESRVALFGLGAAREACEASGWPPHYDPSRVGIFLGTSGERIDLRVMAEVAYQARGSNGDIDRARYVEEYCRRLGNGYVLRMLPQQLTARIAELYGISGVGCTFQTACTSSAQAIGEGLKAIQRGSADLVIAGGSECIVSPLEILIFCHLGALSKRNGEPEKASRPFDAQRDGFILGEGAGILVLERADLAVKRNAPILAELAGYGTSCDAYRVTDEAPDGRGAILAMGRALKEAGLSPAEIDYINAHGTSTPMNDRVETLAIKTLFGGQAYKVPVSSTKSMIGHTISAAGAIELITCVLALRDQIMPPTINYEFPDPDCDLDYVPNQARQARLKAVLSNSFGFGGHNDCLVVRQFSS